MKYDDASWHYNGNYPKDLPKQNASTHIGMFLAWMIDHDFISDLHKTNSAETLEQIKKREITGAQFLIKSCDEKLTNDDLNDAGNAFAQEYYEKEYMTDYVDALDEDTFDTIYEVKDTWENYAKLKPVIDKKFEVWHK